MYIINDKIYYFVIFYNNLLSTAVKLTSHCIIPRKMNIPEFGMQFLTTMLHPFQSIMRNMWKSIMRKFMRIQNFICFDFICCYIFFKLRANQYLWNISSVMNAGFFGWGGYSKSFGVRFSRVATELYYCALKRESSGTC